MPLLLPLLSKYWKVIAGAVIVLALGVYIAFLKVSLADCQKHVVMFQAVQARNEAAIQAQNKAVRKLWADGRILREKSQSSGVAAQKEVAQAVAAISRPVDLTGKTCDADVSEIWRMVRRIP